MSLKAQLKKIIKGEVRDGVETLNKYSHDASLFEIKPQIVVFPKDAKDIKNIVKFVNKYNSSAIKKLSITARGAGSGMTGGSLSDSIVLDLKHLNRLKKIVRPRRSADGGYAIVQPGLLYRDFEKETLKRSLLLPSYPASKELASLGGMVANNAGGEKSLIYGKTENYVQELKVVLTDGNEYTIKPLTKAGFIKKTRQKNFEFEGEVYKKIYKLITDNRSAIAKAKPRVSKNSAGYALWNIADADFTKFDLTKLFTGAQGTLGIITEIKLRLIKPKKYSELLVILLKNSKPLAKIVQATLKHRPESFEFFDDFTLKLGIRYFFGRFAWQFLPELWLIAKNGFRLPKIILLAEFTGDTIKEAEQKARIAQKNLEKFHLATRLTTSEKDTRKYWTVRRESFDLLRHKIKGKKTAPFIDDIIVRPEYLPRFLPRLKKILNRSGVIYTIAGHIGDGNLHIIPLMDLTDKNFKKTISDLARKVYGLVFQFHGSMTAEHNDGLIRAPYLKKMYGAKIYRLFEKTKTIFDPNDIFNPHKKINSDKGYPQAHLKKR